jgi:hypothetical protein
MGQRGARDSRSVEAGEGDLFARYRHRKRSRCMKIRRAIGVDPAVALRYE